MEELPQTVHVTLPFAVAVAKFSFRSRTNKLQPLDLVLSCSPTKFDFIGSNNCDERSESWPYNIKYEKWETILSVTGVVWTSLDQEQSWEIPKEKRRSYKCFGFRVLENGLGQAAAIQDAKLFKGTVHFCF